eukprot:scaffold162298_cov19-Tisochrysis_lutea.AAC.1
MQTAVPPISHSNRGRGEGGCKQTESAKPTREHGAVGFVGLVDFVADDIQRAASFAACDIQRAAATSKGLVRKHPSEVMSHSLTRGHVLRPLLWQCWHESHCAMQTHSVTIMRRHSEHGTGIVRVRQAMD